MSGPTDAGGVPVPSWQIFAVFDLSRVRADLSRVLLDVGPTIIDSVRGQAKDVSRRLETNRPPLQAQEAQHQAYSKMCTPHLMTLGLL